MIVISPILFDIEGALIINTDDNNSNFGKASRRQNRIATLDGGSVLQDRGFSNSDLTFSLSTKNFSQAKFDRLRFMVAAYAEVRIACRIGSFIGSITKLSDKDSNFEFLVTKND